MRTHEKSEGWETMGGVAERTKAEEKFQERQTERQQKKLESKAKGA